MATTDVDCPMCGTTREIVPDEYGVFTVQCDACGGAAEGEYRQGRDVVVWRWRKPLDE